MKRLLMLAVLLGLPAAVSAQQAAPELSLSANGRQRINLYSGWPLIAHVTIMNSLRFGGSSGSAPLVIGPNGSAWTSAIQFTAVSSSGSTLQWPLKLVGVPDSASLTLPPTSYIRAFWQMSPADASAIPPDTYQLTATLQVANSSGWNGVVQSRPMTILVAPEPSLPPDLQSEKAILLSEYATNAGDLETALAGLQQLVQAQPNNTLAMSAAANVLELRGYPGLAYFQVRDAVTAYYAGNPSSTEPPANMLTILKRSMEAMLAADAAEAPTTTSVLAPSVIFSPSSQTVTLSATVAAATGPVDGGTVTFVVSGVGSPVTSPPVAQGNASVSFTVPGATGAGAYSVQATYTGTANFAPSVDSADNLTISKATPTITWNTPASIASGTALGSAQLNATASVPGTFVYNPPAGTVLPSGTTQTLSVTFTPADATDYNSATASVSVTILGGTYTGSISPTSATIPVGSSQTFNITVNSGTFDGALALTCANPPAGITCQFQPPQVNLSPNGSSSTMLTVSVSTKPAALIFETPAAPFKQLPSSRVMVVLLTLALLAVTLLRTARDLQRGALVQRRAALARLAVTLLLLASFNVAACTSAQVVGNGPSHNGGGGSASPANVTLTIQGGSGASAVNITTLTISVP